MKDECEANARRIVAAVNACAGIPTEELERSTFLAEFEGFKHALFGKELRITEAERLLQGLRDQHQPGIGWPSDIAIKVDAFLRDAQR